MKKTLKSVPKSVETSRYKKNEPALFISEKKGKRYLVINPASPLIQGFASVDDQVSSFSMPTFSPGPMMNGFQSFQIPYSNFPSAFGSPSVVRSPYVGMKMNGFPLIGGQSDMSGIFRGYVAVPITTRFPFSPSMYGSFPSFQSMGSQFGYGEGFRMLFDHGNEIRTPFHQEIDLRGSSYRSNFFHSPYTQMEREGERMENNGYFDPRSTVDNYQHDYNLGDPEIDRNDERKVSKMFGGLFRENSNFDQVTGPQGEPAVAASPSGPAAAAVQSPGSAAVDPPFQNERSYENFKRSENARPHPYVFTKEHVGFGPITVEAHTASYKGEDPKDDE